MIDLNKIEIKCITFLLWSWAFVQGMSTSLSIVMSLMMILFSIYMCAKHGSVIVKQKLPLPYKLIFLVATFLFISLIYNWNEMSEPTRGLSKLRYFLIPLLTLPWLYLLKINEQHKKIFFHTILLLIVSYTVASIAGMVVMFCNFDISHWRSAYNDRNQGLTGIMQYAFETPLVVFTGLFCLTKLKDKFSNSKIWLIRICLLIMFFGLMISNSRGGIIGLGFGLGLFTLYDWKNTWKKIILPISPVVIILIILIYVFKPVMITGSRFFNPEVTKSTNIRSELNRLSIIAFRDKPFIGHGLLSPKFNYSSYEDNAKKFRFYLADTHNTFTQVLVDGGIFSFIFYISLFIIILYRNIKSKNKTLQFMCVIWFPFLLMSFVHTMLVTGTGTAVLLMLFLITNNIMLDNKSLRESL